MTRVTIGVHVHAEPARLRATLASLAADLRNGVEVVLLPDGPDAEVRDALRGLGGLRQSGTPEPRGPAACFNRLAAMSDAGILVLLESGCEAGPRWLEHLLAALRADPANGLAGPSTNRAWNEQAAFPRAKGGSVHVARTAAEAERSFGAGAPELAPLHSLADFCRAVRREVVEAVDAADEEYGDAPCWEMDYNVRAARAGFRGVWAQAAYVWRAPFTARRRASEPRRLRASLERYQDKFCALRLRGTGAGCGSSGCRGDACEHFAPRELIQVSLPRRRAEPLPAPPAEPVIQVAPVRSLPLVSCMLPTRNRAEFVLQAVRYFERQDYPERELIVIDDGDDDLGSRLPASERIRYVRVDRRLSIGAKRNRACAEARGEILVHWDDDDWYAPGRLSAQAAPILAGRADVTGLVAGVFFELPRWTFWTCSPALHRRLFVGNVHGGTLAYRRGVLRHARYPDQSLAEDAAFLQQALRRGARLARIDDPSLFVYLRHGANSWVFRCGEHLDRKGWQRTSEPAWPAADRDFYIRHSPAASANGTAAAHAGVRSRRPLVSCIMPTCDRRPFVPRAVEYFLRQDYPERELIVLDDGTQPVDDLIPADPRIRYVRLPLRQRIGAKRNLACREASGEVIVHWDDDDWNAPWRLRYQVESLLEAGADLCGLNRPLFYSPAGDRAWQYVYTGRRAWVYGATLCYTRAFWERQPFQDVSVGEDNKFVWNSPETRLITLPDSRFHISMIHRRNTSPKRVGGSSWRSVPCDGIRTLLGSDLAFYQGPGINHPAGS